MSEVLVGISEIASLASGANSVLQIKDRLLDKLGPDENPEDIVEEDENLIVIEAGGKKYVADIESLNPKTAERMVEIFEERPDDLNLTIFTEDFADDARNYQEQFDKGLEEVEDLIEYCGSEKRSVINLAEQVNNHYENDRHDDASSIKRDISKMYGKRGVKLCNLFTSGYIANAASHFKDLLTEDMSFEERQELAQDLMDQVMESAETIYFVSKHDDSEDIIRSIKADIEGQESYIAVHSAGKGNVDTAKSVLGEVQSAAVENGYNVKSGKPNTSSSAPHLRIIMTLREEKIIQS